MIINSIHIEENGVKRFITFSDRNNLIHSYANSKGKTTLLRLMLYSIGYSVPNTKHIKFENCKVESQITLDNGEVLLLYRESKVAQSVELVAHQIVDVAAVGQLLVLNLKIILN